MLSKSFKDVYDLFKMAFYSSLCKNGDELTMQEAFSLDVIHMLGAPTILEFANYMGISQSNATYKINQMIKKGYLIKGCCEGDKRSFRLQVTKKFIDCYRVNDLYIGEILGLIEKAFDSEKVALLEAMLISIKKELETKGEQFYD